MKIDEFNKYKSIAESQDPEIVRSFPQSDRIHTWMKDSGRLDEGLFSGIWSWLKKNFSPTARKIHNLAEEYHKELMSEGRAEYNKTKDPKDLASKFRAGSYNRLSRDIEERMEILAEDDEDYRNLVRTLINKKNLEVKKALISELSGKMDPDDFSMYISPIEKETDIKLKKASEEYEKSSRKIMGEKKDIFDSTMKFLDKKLTDERSFFKPVGISSGEEKRDFIKLLFIYVSNLSEKFKEYNLDEKTVYKIAREYVDAVKEIAKKIESKGKSYDEAVSLAKKAIDRQMREVKPLPFDKIKPIAAKEAEKSEPSESSTEIVSPHTDDLLSKDEIKDAIDDAKQDTGKQNPSDREIAEQIESEVKKLFTKDNIPRYTEKINNHIESFNSSNDTKRKEMMRDYDYDLDQDNKIKKASESDIAEMVPSYIDVVGAIVPFFQKKEDSINVAMKTVQRFMFEMYAMKKDASKKLSSSEKDKLISNIKEKYPDLF